jgi:hypothetical protein
VFGAEVIVHLDAGGRVTALTDGLAHDIAVGVRPAIDLRSALGTAITANAHSSGQLTSTVDLQVLRRFGKDLLTYRIQLEYEQGGEPFRPVVFVDAMDGTVVWSYDDLRTARDRRIYSANHGTSLPGSLVRVEGNVANADVDINASYDVLGSTYDCYRNRNFSGSGVYSVWLRDDSGAASSIFSTAGIAVASYDTLRIEYSAFVIGMEAGEGYFVEIQRDNGAWETMANLVHGTDFVNNFRHTGDRRVPLAGASTVKVRFRCDGSDNSDSIYLDDVRLSAR